MKRNQTAYVILGLLSIESNQSGYDIHKTIEGSVSYFWGESYGQIYPTLKRLAAEGLIEPGKSTSSARPQRRQYCLTDAGRARLQEWLAGPFSGGSPPRLASRSGTFASFRTSSGACSPPCWRLKLSVARVTGIILTSHSGC